MATSSPSPGPSSASGGNPHGEQGALLQIKEGGLVVYVAGLLQPSRRRWQGRGAVTHADREVPRGAAH
jgi:hypothetical protein